MWCCGSDSRQTYEDANKNRGTNQRERVHDHISTAVDGINSAEIFWNNLESVHNDLVDEGVLNFSVSPDVQSILAVAGDITRVILPNLLNLSSSIPFVGVVGIALVQFYSALKQTMENREKVKVIEDQVNDSVRWLGHTYKLFNKLKDRSPITFPDFIIKVKILTAMIGKSTDLVSKFSVGTLNMITLAKYSKRLFFNSKDESDIISFNKNHEKARSDISLYFSSVLAEAFDSIMNSAGEDSIMNKIKNLLLPKKISIDSDVNKHLKRFVPGTREWMLTVCNKCIQTILLCCDFMCIILIFR
jgi:hypothetical protein